MNQPVNQLMNQPVNQPMNLVQFVRCFTSEELFSVKDLVMVSNSVYLCPQKIKKVISQSRQQPFSTGMYLGRTDQVGRSDQKYFIPSFQLLDWLMTHTARKIMLHEKAAWLFICGRDVFKEGIQGILESAQGLKDGDLVLLQNSFGECLGLGSFQTGKKVAVSRILDRGDFLRRER